MPQKVAFLHDQALILAFWRCQNLWDLIRDPLIKPRYTKRHEYQSHTTPVLCTLAQ